MGKCVVRIRTQAKKLMSEVAPTSGKVLWSIKNFYDPCGPRLEMQSPKILYLESFLLWKINMENFLESWQTAQQLVIVIGTCRYLRTVHSAVLRLTVNFNKL